MPFKVNVDRRHRIPRQRHRVTNWAAYDAGLRARSSLTVWFSEAAVDGWRAEARTTRGGQPRYSALAITTALTLRQTEEVVGSILALLGLDLAVPTTARSAAGPRRWKCPAAVRARARCICSWTAPVKLSGPGERLVEKHGSRRRRGWRKLHLSVDAGTGRIIASALTTKDADDGSQVGPLLDQVNGPVASFTADGAFDRDDAYAEVTAWHPDAAVVVLPRSSAVPSGTAETVPTQRDAHLRCIGERGRTG